MSFPALEFFSGIAMGYIPYTSPAKIELGQLGPVNQLRCKQRRLKLSGGHSLEGSLLGREQMGLARRLATGEAAWRKSAESLSLSAVRGARNPEGRVYLAGLRERKADERT